MILISKKSFKMITINLSKQQALDAGSKAIQEINFTENLTRDQNTTLVLKNRKKPFVSKTLFCFNTTSV